MISKPVQAHSFYHTCRYIANKPGSELLIAVGVRAHDFMVMAEDFLNQQQLRPTKEKACFHGILSFYPGENPSDDLLKEIALKYLAKQGIVNTQFAISKHTDKAHLHLHIVANMVDNNGNAISDSWIGLRGKKIAQKLTDEYQLIPAVKKDLKLTHLEALSQSEADKYRIYQAIAESLPYCRALRELEARLLKQGIETQYKYKGQTQEKQGVSFKIGTICFKGSQVDRSFSLAGLEKILSQQQKQGQTQEHTLRQKPEQQDKTATQKQPMAIRPRSLTKSEEVNHSPGIPLSSGMEKIAQILMRSEEMGGPGGGESNADYLRRKKKKKKRPRH
ncbi:relaxase/mobilization nuclease domain-containing protein [Flavitalea flava]